ncbi:unnamed protein product [Amoebophrya sp. A25]|nr:unnamed protein product [Amoebophrya sp. A25]|eukprot:GSA25T00008131001.1
MFVMREGATSGGRGGVVVTAGRQNVSGHLQSSVSERPDDCGLALAKYFWATSTATNPGKSKFLKRKRNSDQAESRGKFTTFMCEGSISFHGRRSNRSRWDIVPLLKKTTEK